MAHIDLTAQSQTAFANACNVMGGMLALTASLGLSMSLLISRGITRQLALGAELAKLTSGTELNETGDAERHDAEPVQERAAAAGPSMRDEPSTLTSAMAVFRLSLEGAAEASAAPPAEQCGPDCATNVIWLPRRVRPGAIAAQLLAEAARRTLAERDATTDSQQY